MSLMRKINKPTATEGGRSASSVVAAAAALILAFVVGPVAAAPSVSFTSPADGSTFDVGEDVNPEGRASTSADGDGLDLVLVLDASGSMRNTATADGVTKTRRAWMIDAAVALVNSLPEGNVSVGVVEFRGTSAFTLIELTATTSRDEIVAAINNVAASGVTPTAAGIDAGTAMLTGSGATEGRSKQMVVISDGRPNRSNRSGLTGQPAAEAAAADAAGAGIVVHGVVIPGGSGDSKKAIVDAANAVFPDSDPGIFIDFSNVDDLGGLEAFFGAGGGFAGLAQLDILLPDGTRLEDVTTDAFGNFRVPTWAILEGANTFTAIATFQDGSSATATLTLFGVADNGNDGSVPVPAPAPVGLLLLGLGGLVALRRRPR